MSTGREHQVLVVGQAFWSPSGNHPDGQVLIDHDHRLSLLRSDSVVEVATENWIGFHISIEGCLELVGQVPSGDSGQDLPTLGRQSGVTLTPALAALS